MVLKKWNDLPKNMKNESIRSYYELLYKKRSRLLLKRVFDVVVAIITFIILSPIFIILSLAIKIDSKGPIMFRQVRVTQYCKNFRIFKFRTMVNNADKIGTQVTTKNDARVTRVGKFLRKLRLDEIPQLFNIISGDMSFVGTRPEVPKYTEQYSQEMMATLLLPAGVTSLASIYYKDEAELLDAAEDTDKVYMEDVLPGKMYYNLKAIEEFSFWGEIKIMLMTAFVVLGKEYKGDYVALNKEEIMK
jgi:lipopolysaccharide/colanic/teichoic acid biosynthesis glycosyltransferase